LLWGADLRAADFEQAAQLDRSWTNYSFMFVDSDLLLDAGLSFNSVRKSGIGKFSFQFSLELGIAAVCCRGHIARPPTPRLRSAKYTDKWARI